LKYWPFIKQRFTVIYVITILEPSPEKPSGRPTHKWTCT